MPDVRDISPSREYLADDELSGQVLRMIRRQLGRMKEFSWRTSRVHNKEINVNKQAFNVRLPGYPLTWSEQGAVVIASMDR